MPHVDLKHGHFNWVDLITPDPAAAVRFYGGLFGWSTRESPAEHGEAYITFLKGDAPVAGLTTMSPELIQQGMRPAWTAYVLVDDLDAAAGTATAAGAQLLMPPMDVSEAGRMCMIADPTGAVVVLWQAGGHRGADLFNEHGTLSWNELITRDQAAAVEFYGEVFGWGWEELPMPGGAVYKLCKVDGRMNGGVMAMTDEWPAETPSYWATYFAVDDVDASHARVLELGGGTIEGPMDVAVGRMAVVHDPQGGFFTLFRSNADRRG